MRNISNTCINGQLHRTLATGLDYALYGRLLKQFTDNRLPLQAKQLHARLVLFSSTPDNFLASKFIVLYSKTNHISQARLVFDQIPTKNTFSYNAMLIGYSLNDRHFDTLHLFSRLARSGACHARPNNYSVTCLLKSLSSLLYSEVRLGKEIHGFVMTAGLAADVVVMNSLITYYSRCDDDMVSARKVFDRMTDRDVVTWNAMISGYSQGGFYEDCKEFYKEMVDSSGFNPNSVTVVSVLQACGQTTDLVFGMEVHRFVVDNKVAVDLAVCNALIGLYAKCGSLDYARELFDEMMEKDEVTYGAIISGYMDHGYVELGMELFREMKSRGLSTWNAVISGLVQNNRDNGGLDLVREMLRDGFRPNTVTISSILPTLWNLKGGKEIHGYAVKHGYDKCIYVATAVVDIYAKLGFLSGAQKVFDRSKNRNLIIWTAIISAYSAHGDVNSVLNLFDEMLNDGIQPDPVTFTAVLAACAHCGMVDQSWEIFDTMFTKYGIEPSMEHYACMVGVLSRAGRLSEATDFVSKMLVEPSAKVWGALLHGASVFGDVELGKFASDHLLKIEPENTGTYIIMANLYSQAGRWKEADEIRERMNSIGLKKIPGTSWIETSEGLQSFIAKDKSSKNTEEIYETLEGLITLMREEGNDMQYELDVQSVYH